MTDAEAERMNAEYAKARTDAEKLAVLMKFMSHDEALDAFAVLERPDPAAETDEETAR